MTLLLKKIFENHQKLDENSEQMSIQCKKLIENLKKGWKISENWARVDKKIVRNRWKLGHKGKNRKISEKLNRNIKNL